MDKEHLDQIRSNPNIISYRWVKEIVFELCTEIELLQSNLVNCQRDLAEGNRQGLLMLEEIRILNQLIPK